jgi:molybdate transport system substrate-binding protein
VASLAIAAMLAGCAPGRPAGAAPGDVELTVFAAASLTEAFNEYRAQLAAQRGGLSVTCSFAGSQQLVAQIESGAPVDVVATADTASMAKLVAAGLVDQPRVFARNRLEIVVGRGNPRHVAGLADLARRDLRVVLADPAVPAGAYGRQALDRQGLRVNPVSLELDVKSALQKVALGEADASIVYATDVKSAGQRVTGVEIPIEQNVATAYPVAVVRATPHRQPAQLFVDQLISGAGSRALQAQGFSPP